MATISSTYDTVEAKFGSGLESRLVSCLSSLRTLPPYHEPPNFVYISDSVRLWVNGIYAIYLYIDGEELGRIIVTRWDQWHARPNAKARHFQHDKMTHYDIAAHHMMTCGGGKLRIWDTIKWAYIELDAITFKYFRPRSGPTGFIRAIASDEKVTWYDLDGQKVPDQIPKPGDCTCFLSFPGSGYLFVQYGRCALYGESGEASFDLPSFDSVWVIDGSSFLTLAGSKATIYSTSGSIIEEGEVPR